MEIRNTIEINVSGPTFGQDSRVRIIAKPSRYSKIRYWVVLPGMRNRRERWLLVPTPEQAIGHISRWLVARAEKVFAGSQAAAEGKPSADRLQPGALKMISDCASMKDSEISTNKK
jgi:hypothetical protein